MRRLRLIFPWVVLIVCAAGFVAGLFLGCFWTTSGGCGVDLYAGSLVFRREAAGHPQQLGMTFEWSSPGWSEMGYSRPIRYHSSSQRRYEDELRLAGFGWRAFGPYDNAREASGFFLFIPLWLPALGGAMWLIRRRFQRRRMRAGFEVLASAPAQAPPPRE